MKTIGELPTSYEISMSYEEQLLLFCKKINEIIDELEKYTPIDDLSKVAFTGNYNDLTNKPTIPTATSQLTNDSDFTTKTYVDELVGDINTALDTINGEVI